MIVQWRKSSHSGGVDDKACVELGRLERGIGVRDSRAPERGHLTRTSAEFGVLLRWVEQHPER
jgi:hypothetical protein